MVPEKSYELAVRWFCSRDEAKQKRKELNCLLLDKYKEKMCIKENA